MVKKEKKKSRFLANLGNCIQCKYGWTNDDQRNSTNEHGMGPVAGVYICVHVTTRTKLWAGFLSRRCTHRQKETTLLSKSHCGYVRRTIPSPPPPPPPPPPPSPQSLADDAGQVSVSSARKVRMGEKIDAVGRFRLANGSQLQEAISEFVFERAATECCTEVKHTNNTTLIGTTSPRTRGVI